MGRLVWIVNNINSIVISTILYNALHVRDALLLQTTSFSWERHCKEEVLTFFPEIKKQDYVCYSPICLLIKQKESPEFHLSDSRSSIPENIGLQNKNIFITLKLKRT